MNNIPPERSFLDRLTAYFINSQVTILLILALIVFGLFAAIVTPKEENPQIIVPAADIYISYPGARAEVVEEMVVVRMEAEIRELTGVDHIYSQTENSRGKITVQFYVGEDWEQSLFKLQNQLFNHQDYLLPPEATYIVKPINVDDVAIATLTVTGKDYSEDRLRRIGEKLLQELRKIPQTANFVISGGQGRAILVDLNPDKLAAYRLSFPQIAQRLQGENTESTAGDIAIGENRLYVRIGNLFESAADLGEVIVGYSPLYGEGDNSEFIPPIYLKDVATIKDDYSDRTTTLSRMAYRQDWDITEPDRDPSLRPQADFITQPAITIGIAKKNGTNAVTVAKQIFKKVDELKSQLPPGVEIAVTRNDGRTANRAVNELYTSLALAIAIVAALLIPFLGWRSAAIIVVVIPLTIAGTLGVGWLAGQTINRITLFAIILALGTLIDDTIAVTENIQRRFDLEPPSNLHHKTQIALAAVRELSSPIILSTITVILAFLPMGFVTGMMGPYMNPIPFNVPVAMVISTFMALTVIPFLALRWIKIRPNSQNSGDRFADFYRRLMLPFFASRSRRRFLFLSVTGLLLICLTFPVLQIVKFRMLPKADKDTFLVQLEAPNGTNLNATDRIVRDLETVLKQSPEITSFETYVGTKSPVDFNGLFRGGSATPVIERVPLTLSSVGYTPSPLPKVSMQFPMPENTADIRVHLTDKKSRPQDSETIVLNLRPQLTAVAERHNSVVKLIEDSPGPPVRSTILAEIYGNNYDKQRELAKQVRQVFHQTKEVVDIDDSVRNQVPQMQLILDRDKISAAGLSTTQVAQEVTAALSGVNVSTLRVPGEIFPVPIRIRLSSEDRQSLTDLHRLQLRTPNDEMIPLSELISFVPTTVDRPIYHKDQQPVTYVSGEMGDRSSVYAVIGQLIHFWRHPLPDGYWIEWDGEWKLTLDVFRDLGLAMLIAIMLIYFILVGQFRSFRIPLIIIGTVPLATIGILMGFAVNGVYFSATGMIGAIALSGIVVRNAIVLLEFIETRRQLGVSLENSILEAGAARFRPIVLTSLTTMLGTVPLLSDPVWSGLAWSLLSGMLTSTALTLIIIPLAYYGEYYLSEQVKYYQDLDLALSQIRGAEGVVKRFSNK